MAQHLSLEKFKENMRFFLEALTSPDSPYAIADTPVSIILITPGPCALTQLSHWKRGCISRERFNEFRQAVLDLAEEWKVKEVLDIKHKQGGLSWKLGVIDFWDTLITAAGGDGVELEPYHL
jgi:hypothetical protein